MLAREWNGRMHRVAVLADGFAWNGKTYPSLSKIAFAITGTRWNGPGFSAYATGPDKRRRSCGYESSKDLNRSAAPSTPVSRPTRD